MENQLKFNLIDLSYMVEISRGDLDYERQVTKLFIETIPQDLHNLELYSDLKSLDNLKKTLHHMQSSISIMGLDKKLSNFIDMDAYEEANNEQIKEKIDFIKITCLKAIEEAKEYLKVLG